MFLFSHVKVEAICIFLHMCVAHSWRDVAGCLKGGILVKSDMKRGKVTDGHRLRCALRKGCVCFSSHLFWNNFHSCLVVSN